MEIAKNSTVAAVFTVRLFSIRKLNYFFFLFSFFFLLLSILFNFLRWIYDIFSCAAHIEQLNIGYYYYYYY